MGMKLGLIFAAILLIAASAAADVVIKQKTAVDMMGFMNMDMDGTQYVKGDKSYTGGETKMKGGMAAMMGGGGASEFAEITRLDKGVLWHLQPDKKTYTETNLSEFKEDMAKGQQNMPAEDDDADQYDWTVKVTASDASENINGFDCKKITGDASGVKKDDPEDKVHIVYEYWYARDVAGYDELLSHYKKFGEVTGVDMMQAQHGAEQLFAKYSSQFGEMVEQMKKAEGVPIKMNIMVESTQAAEAAEEEAPADTEGMPPGMKEMLSGLMGRGQTKSEGGMAKVFSMTNEVTSITTKAVDDGQFEIPADYKKK